MRTKANGQSERESRGKGGNREETEVREGFRGRRVLLARLRRPWGVSLGAMGAERSSTNVSSGSSVGGSRSRFCINEIAAI